MDKVKDLEMEILSWTFQVGPLSPYKPLIVEEDGIRVDQKDEIKEGVYIQKYEKDSTHHS